MSEILQKICDPVRSELALVEERLAALPRARNKAVLEAVSAILNAGGKRLRPALLLLAAKSCGCTTERGVHLAAAVELIHTASLIHDDIIDNADRRRGVASINARAGNKIAVLAGDYVYAAVFGILAEDGDQEVMRTVAAAAAHMTDSEIAQTLCRNDARVTEEQYLSIITGKTASLLSCACRIGAMLGDTRNGETDTLARYGLDLGMAFQITDDLLDLVGDEQDVGKPLGNDMREGRLTLPFIHTLRVAAQSDREWIATTFESRRLDERALTRLSELVQKYGGIDYGRQRAAEYGQACKQRLQALPASEYQASLALLVDYVMRRA